MLTDSFNLSVTGGVWVVELVAGDEGFSDVVEDVVEGSGYTKVCKLCIETIVN